MKRVKGMYRIGDIVLVNRWPTGHIVKDYCYAAEILEIKDDVSLNWTGASLDQVYYRIKPWIDEGLVYDIADQEPASSDLLHAIKSLSSKSFWMGHNSLSPLEYDEDTGCYEMRYNDDDLESWDGC